MKHSACCGCLGGCTAAGCLPGVGGCAGLTEPVDMVVVNMVVVVVFPLGAQKSRLKIVLYDIEAISNCERCQNMQTSSLRWGMGGVGFKGCLKF